MSALKIRKRPKCLQKINWDPTSKTCRSKVGYVHGYLLSLYFYIIVNFYVINKYDDMLCFIECKMNVTHPHRFFIILFLPTMIIITADTFLSTLEESHETACAGYEREYRMLTLRLPIKTRQQNWYQFIHGSLVT